MRTIAVIDDERTIRDIVSEVLRDAQAEVYCAHDGAHGRRLLESRRFDLAVIDVQLPGLPGLELARVAMARGTPSVMMSGHPDAAEQRGLPCLLKPFRLDALTRKAEEVMTDREGTLRRVRQAMARMQIGWKWAENSDGAGTYRTH
jgi:DNA-binding response OmpR family regulator